MLDGKKGKKEQTGKKRKEEREGRERQNYKEERRDGRRKEGKMIENSPLRQWCIGKYLTISFQKTNKQTKQNTRLSL